MAETLQVLSSDTTKNKTSGTTNNRTREGASRVRRDGLERLRWAADRRLGKNLKQLIERIAAKALKGDQASIKLLVSLAERKKPRPLPVKKPRGVRWARRLSLEPAFQGELDEGRADSSTAVKAER